MGQTRYTPEQIIGKLRQAGVRSAEGATVAEIVRELRITQPERVESVWRRFGGGPGDSLCPRTLITPCCALI